MLFLKSDSNSKHFSFFVFYFNVSNKIYLTLHPTTIILILPD